MLRKVISNRLERGKIDFTLTVENTSQSSATLINTAVVRGYMEQLQTITPEASSVDLLGIVMRLPKAISTPLEEVDEEEFALIEKQLLIALEHLQDFRSKEGAILKKDFSLRISNIQDLLQQVEVLDEERF